VTLVKVILVPVSHDFNYNIKGFDLIFTPPPHETTSDPPSGQAFCFFSGPPFWRKLIPSIATPARLRTVKEEAKEKTHTPVFKRILSNTFPLTLGWMRGIVEKKARHC